MGDENELGGRCEGAGSDSFFFFVRPLRCAVLDLGARGGQSFSGWIAKIWPIRKIDEGRRAFLF